MDSKENPYYNPKAFGYKTVGEVNWDDEPYQFDFTVVWAKESGELVWADDSGCSCPSPFENHSEADYHKGTKLELLIHLTNRITVLLESSYVSSETKNYAAQQVSDLVEKVILGGYK